MTPELLGPIRLLPLRLTAILSLLAGTVYFFRGSPMPYHQRYLGTPFAQLPPGTRGLILALLHATGCGLITTGLALAFLSWGPLPSHDAWAIKATWLILLSSTVSMAIVTLKLGVRTPWWLILLCGASSMAGLWSYT
jgi:hypothetical protein